MPRPNLRMLVATIQGQLDALTAAVADTPEPAARLTELRLSWAALLHVLPLHEPPFQGCPICMRVVPRGATFCGTCFSRLTPASILS